MITHISTIVYSNVNGVGNFLETEGFVMNNVLYRDRSLPFLTAGGFRNICYREWGDPKNPKVVICVHGLSRNRLDFDTLAAAICAHYRVVAIDMPGRGKSDWLDNKEDYNYLWSIKDQPPLFHNILTSLIARLDVHSVDWIGTSMGGLLGIEIAAQKASPIQRLILNDIGPFVSGASRQANAALANAAGEYETEAEAVAFVLESKKAFGPFTEEAAHKFALDSISRSSDGKWRMHYDPMITHSRKKLDTDLWDAWKRICCPVLTIWGEESTLLSEETVQKMRSTGPKTNLLSMPGIGHCPGLTSSIEIDTIKNFLN